MVTTLIIERCKQREQSAFQQCYTACAPYVYTIIKNYVSDSELQKDVMQEVFVSAFKSIASFDETKGKFKSWISQITVNKCIDTLRNEKKLSLFIPLNDQHEVAVDQEKILDALDPEALKALLSDMPLGYKTVFLLHIVDGYSHKEIGERLNITPETSRSQLFRAIKWVKKHLLIDTKHLIYG